VGRAERRDRQERIERELARERGQALVRIAGMLEHLIEQLEALGAAWRAAPDEGLREELASRYRATRHEALRYRWYLEVQREALGLTRHAVLDEIYRVPPALGTATSGAPRDGTEPGRDPHR
jgi:hypothetical protein